MAKKELTDVKITDTKKTKREKLIEEAKVLGLTFQDNVTAKELKALIQTEKLKADLPAPPPPPPVLSFTKLKNQDVIVRVGVGVGARLLQSFATISGVDVWKDLCLVMPTGAPKVTIRATSLDGKKPTQKVKKVRLLQGGRKGKVLETMKL